MSQVDVMMVVLIGVILWVTLLTILTNVRIETLWDHVERLRADHERDR